MCPLVILAPPTAKTLVTGLDVKNFASQISLDTRL